MARVRSVSAARGILRGVRLDWRTSPSRSAALCIVLGTAACTAPPAAPAPQAVVSFDGTYTASIRLTGNTSSADPKWCEVDRTAIFQVVQNRFSYTQKHPQVPGEQVMTYNATIAQDGSLSGASERTTEMKGRVVGGRMEGVIHGALCYYDFVAERQ